MNYANRQTSWLLASMILVLFSGGTALAEDTELFIAGEDTYAYDSAARPNILFVIDTSGSMESDVTTQVDWDPSVTFSGCYESWRVYWAYNSNQPSCGTNRWFGKSKNLCLAAQQSMEGLGVYEGDLRAYRPRNNPNKSRWVSLKANKHWRDVECLEDAGIHGASLGTYYAADGVNGPFASVPDYQPSWVNHYHLFDGNYLNWLTSGSTITKERIEIVQEVTNNLLDNLTGVNVGLMRFNYDDGGPVVYAMENIEDARAGIKTAINNLEAGGWTPLSETLYEAHQYFTGGSVDYGSGFTHESVAASRVGNTTSSGTYLSPIEFGCQKNYIIFLTDGEPTRDRGAENDIEGLPQFQQYSGAAQCERGDPFTSGSSHPDDAICMDELAEYMHEKDLSDLYGSQTVATYTIGFTVDLDLLESTAERGGGFYYRADDTAGLAGALTTIAITIMGDASAFAAPSVPVNAFNRTQNLNDIFVSVFNPSSTVHWPGNVKKYSLIGGQMIDADGLAAIDPVTGYFADEARSFWSVESDGDRSYEGGAGENLPEYTVRKVYTNIAGGDLNMPANRIQLSNTAITAEMLDVIDNEAAAQAAGEDSERTKLINWINGLDVHDDNDNDLVTDTRRQIGDPLHVRPVPVIYGGSAAAPDMTVYFATNDGFFHAIDPDDGTELWSWVPEQLLPLMISKYDDEQKATRVYGIDGEITGAIVNNDFAGGISGDEQAILTFGMRRGGDSVFALDVTDRNDPQLLWEINAETDGFEDLGQTWSTPQVTKVKVDADYIDVVLFGGGYDAGQDSDFYREDSVGNAIYMVNLLTGEKIWSAGASDDYDLELPGMEHSIPAPLRAVDINGDGLLDRIYVGDMGGRLWRFDIFNGESVNELGQGGVIATLGAADLGSPTAADVRRFYNQVDVVDYSQDGVRFLSLNVGSGYRAHPLDREIDEEFYSVRDYAPINQLQNDDYGDPVIRSQLTDITALANAPLDSDDAGWRLSMVRSLGEKVLSRAITYRNTIYFTSFSPGSTASACSTAPGTNRLYKVDLLTGDPILNLDESVDAENLTEDDRSRILKQGSIAPQVEILFTADNPTVGTECVGTECAVSDKSSLATRTYWTQDGAQ